MVCQVDDIALGFALDGAVRRIYEAGQAVRQPVITPSLSARAVHTLLDHRPFAVARHDETMQVEVKSILNRRAIDLGDQATGAPKRRAVDTCPIAYQQQLLWRLAGMLSPSATHINPKLVL